MKRITDRSNQYARGRENHVLMTENIFPLFAKLPMRGLRRVTAFLNGEKVRVTFAMGTCDRDILSYIATTGGITSEIVKDLMAQCIEYRFGKVNNLPHRIQWLSDNGPSYTARGTIAFAHMMGLEVCTTPYYSPESNGMAESFVRTFKYICA